MKVFKLNGDLIGTHTFWKVQNTGWSGGISWFGTGGSYMNPLRFSNEKDAFEYGMKKKLDFNQDTTLWRVIKVVFDRYENGDVTTKTWVEI